MKLQVNVVNLVGTTRSVEFAGGLNIVTGSITSGKTSLLRLVRAALGGSMANLAPEVRTLVTAVGARLQLRETEFLVVRPVVTTLNAPVDVAGSSVALRLPALQRSPEESLTYGDWLLDQLGLPRVEVPSAPTRPDSSASPVSINDWMLLCDLSQDEIDSSVFGHHDSFKNIKRKYVFQLMLGQYDPSAAALQEELRALTSRIRLLTSEREAFDRFLAGTRLANRAQLFGEREALQAQLHDVEAAMRAVPADLQSVDSRSHTARDELAALDDRIAKLVRDIEKENAAIADLERLRNQLTTQSQRIVRAIVSDEVLLDFEFVVCPRCGKPLDPAGQDDGRCLLCHQEPVPSVSREALIGERARLESQLEETRELIEARQDRLRASTVELDAMQLQRAASGRELDIATETFVSDRAGQIAGTAGLHATTLERLRHVGEYIELHDRLETVLGDLSTFEARRMEIEAELDELLARTEASDERLAYIEHEFESALQALGVPRFADPPTAAIDRRTLLPRVDGRSFDELNSQGLKVLVNVAFALALHRAALELDLLLPNFLMLDGPSSNVGHEGFDRERIDDLYGYFIATAERFSESLQLIVADNDVPPAAENHVKLRLAPGDRLVPV